MRDSSNNAASISARPAADEALIPHPPTPPSRRHPLRPAPVAARPGWPADRPRARPWPAHRPATPGRRSRCRTGAAAGPAGGRTPARPPDKRRPGPGPRPGRPASTVICTAVPHAQPRARTTARSPTRPLASTLAKPYTVCRSRRRTGGDGKGRPRPPPRARRHRRRRRRYKERSQPAHDDHRRAGPNGRRPWPSTTANSSTQGHRHPDMSTTRSAAWPASDGCSWPL
jgi:hypothetical protein